MKKYLLGLVILTSLFSFGAQKVSAAEELTITKTCLPTSCASTGASFSFIINDSNGIIGSSFTLNSSNNYTKTFPNFQNSQMSITQQSTNVYSIIENTPSGWNTPSISCTPTNVLTPNTLSYALSSVTFDYTPNPMVPLAQITCAFTNTKKEIVETDLCSNIAGVQSTVPAGYTTDARGNCTRVVVETDLCANIAGNQATVPAGYTLNAATEQCTLLPPPIPPACKANLVLNPSLETVSGVPMYQVLETGTTQVSSWTRVNSSVNPPVVDQSGGGYSAFQGSKFAWVGNYSGAPTGLIGKLSTPTTIGKKYTLSAMVKKEYSSSIATFKLNLKNSTSGAESAPISLTITQSTSWTMITGTLTANDNYDQVVIRFDLDTNGPWDTDALVDDVHVCRDTSLSTATIKQENLPKLEDSLDTSTPTAEEKASEKKPGFFARTWNWATSPFTQTWNWFFGTPTPPETPASTDERLAKLNVESTPAGINLISPTCFTVSSGNCGTTNWTSTKQGSIPTTTYKYPATATIGTVNYILDSNSLTGCNQGTSGSPANECNVSVASGTTATISAIYKKAPPLPVPACEVGTPNLIANPSFDLVKPDSGINIGGTRTWWYVKTPSTTNVINWSRDQNTEPVVTNWLPPAPNRLPFHGSKFLLINPLGFGPFGVRGHLTTTPQIGVPYVLSARIQSVMWPVAGTVTMRLRNSGTGAQSDPITGSASPQTNNWVLIGGTITPTAYYNQVVLRYSQDGGMGLIDDVRLCKAKTSALKK